MTHPINRAVADAVAPAVSAFDNLLGRRKAKATESDAEDDKEMEEEEASADSEAMDDEEATEEEASAAEDEEAEDKEAEEDEDEMSADFKRGFEKGAAHQLQRISNILTSEEARGKGAAALKVALNAKFSEEEAKAFLAETPAAKGGFKQAMAKQTTTVGADAGPAPQVTDHGWGNAVAKANQLYGRKK